MGKVKLDTYALKGKKRTRVYHFTLPLYGTPYCVYIGGSIRDAAHYVDVDFEGMDAVSGVSPNTCGQAIRIFHSEHGTNYLMLLSPNTNTDNFSIIAHESLHLSWDICESLGIELLPENHEAQAYIMQSIFESASYAMRDYVKRYKIKVNL